MPKHVTQPFAVQPIDVVVSSHGDTLPGGATNGVVPDGFEFWFFGPPGTWLPVSAAHRIERGYRLTSIMVGTAASGMVATPIYVYGPGEIYPDYLLTPLAPNDAPQAGPGFSYQPEGEELITEAMQKIKARHARKGEIVRVIMAICPSVDGRTDKKLVMHF